MLVIRLLTPQIKEMLTKILIEYTRLNEEEKEKIKADLETRLAYLHAESLNVEIIK